MVRELGAEDGALTGGIGILDVKADVEVDANVEGMAVVDVEPRRLVSSSER